MAYENFIPTVWAEAIERSLERDMVFAEDCNRQYDGDVQKMGDSVRILGVGKPSITTTVNKAISLSDPETVEDTSVVLPVTHISYFNYRVDDIDRRQGVGGMMEALHQETSLAVAGEMDKLIASLAADRVAKTYRETATHITADNILGEIDAAILQLYENDIPTSANLTLTVTPRFYMLLKQAYAGLSTDNAGLLENGRVGRYGNVTIKMSNHVATADNGATDLIMLRTDKAIAFVNPLTHTEAYRPESGFSDAVKGFVLYDAKIVRPRELTVMNVKYTA